MWSLGGGTVIWQFYGDWFMEVGNSSSTLCGTCRLGGSALLPAALMNV